MPGHLPSSIHNFFFCKMAANKCAIGSLIPKFSYGHQQDTNLKIKYPNRKPMEAKAPKNEYPPKLAPVDLSHHFSVAARNRVGSDVKKFYKYFAIPGIHNLAGGEHQCIILYGLPNHPSERVADE
ncbi:aromatic amino acid aminotransferase [Histoplasma ohiense]|nr:aromatic amino acid aminotransferase [Histoplasma ohiense (nom. inval.)]